MLHIHVHVSVYTPPVHTQRLTLGMGGAEARTVRIRAITAGLTQKREGVSRDGLTHGQPRAEAPGQLITETNGGVQCTPVSRYAMAALFCNPPAPLAPQNRVGKTILIPRLPASCLPHPCRAGKGRHAHELCLLAATE